MKKVRQLAHHFFYNIAFVKKMIFLFCIGILVPMIFSADSLLFRDRTWNKRTYVSNGQ